VKNKVHRSIFSIALPIGVLFLIFSQWHISSANLENQYHAGVENKTIGFHDSTTIEEKQRGAHVFRLKDSTYFRSLMQNNIEWITLVSWGFQDDYDSPIVTHHNGDSLQILQYDSSWVNRIKSVRAAGFKVFFKPHLWINYPSDEKWRSDIFPKNDENWELWKESYRSFIVRYAKVAERANADMFSIGAEFYRLSVEKPAFWKNLIQEIRSIYSGKITYAANWYHEYEKITFWNDLDYIGIQAYFPLVSTNYPSVQQVSKGWNKYLPIMETLHKKYNRKILFTEMGYKSTADSAIEPWQWIEDYSDQNKLYSPETQANCYQAFFNTFWNKEWFAGVHIWQLRGDYVAKEGEIDLDFTPQGKPAETIIAKGFE